MTIKDLLVHVDASPAATRRLEATLALAADFGARVTALHLIAEPFMRGTTTHVPDSVIREHLSQASAEAGEVLEAATRAAAARGVGLVPRQLAGTLDRLPALFAQEGRHADLIVVGQPDPETGAADDALLVEAAFLETGRPALMLPPAGVGATPFARVTVAWNDSREASRALHDALPLLVAAQEVTVLVVASGDVPVVPGQEPGQAAVDHLLQHGAPARLKTIDHGRQRVGEAILADAGAHADLLVMGGYGHSRLREALFGGATRTLLADAPLPILFSH